MEYNFYILGGCSRFIGAHFEVNIMVVAHAIQKLYLIYRYPRHQGVDTTPLVFYYSLLIILPRRETIIPFFRGNAGLHLHTYIFVL